MKFLNLATLLFLAFSTLQAVTPQIEKDALIALYNSTSGSTKWTEKWNTTTDPCATPIWHGITCDTQSHIIKIELNHNALYGTIPIEIGNLTLLEVLNLRDNNNISGELPTEIGNLLNLKQLSLGNNKFTSTSSTITGLENLEELQLEFNQLTTIPTWIANLDNLNTLSLGYNNITGAIPTWINNMSSLTGLHLSGNEFTQNIPDLSNLSLLYLSLSYNKLSGNIPASIGSITTLTSFLLDHNNLSGPIPNTIVNLTNVTMGISIADNCNLFSNEVEVQDFINSKNGPHAYQNILDTNTHDCTVMAPVIVFILE